MFCLVDLIGIWPYLCISIMLGVLLGNSSLWLDTLQYGYMISFVSCWYLIFGMLVEMNSEVVSGVILKIFCNCTTHTIVVSMQTCEKCINDNRWCLFQMTNNQQTFYTLLNLTLMFAKLKIKNNLHFTVKDGWTYFLLFILLISTIDFKLTMFYSNDQSAKVVTLFQTDTQLYIFSQDFLNLFTVYWNLRTKIQRIRTI